MVRTMHSTLKAEPEDEGGYREPEDEGGYREPEDKGGY